MIANVFQSGVCALKGDCFSNNPGSYSERKGELLICPRFDPLFSGRGFVKFQTQVRVLHRLLLQALKLIHISLIVPTCSTHISWFGPNLEMIETGRSPTHVDLPKMQGLFPSKKEAFGDLPKTARFHMGPRKCSQRPPWPRPTLPLPDCRQQYTANLSDLCTFEWRGEPCHGLGNAVTYYAAQLTILSVQPLLRGCMCSLDPSLKRMATSTGSWKTELSVQCGLALQSVMCTACITFQQILRQAPPAQALSYGPWIRAVCRQSSFLESCSPDYDVD